MGLKEFLEIQSGIAGLHGENGKVPQLYQSLYYLKFFLTRNDNIIGSLCKRKCTGNSELK